MKQKPFFIDLKKLQKVIALQMTDFGRYGERRVNPRTGMAHYFKDNGSSVLGIAHLDTVQGERWSTWARTSKDLYIFSPCLDDRLGAYIILELLPHLGVKVDWLLTEGEESGQSTGADFEPSKLYNWMFQFDRRGDGMVMYQYDNAEMRKMMKESGWKVEWGSFSDICHMNFMECKGFNFGTGYHDEHSVNSYALLSETVGSVTKFVDFYHQYKNTRFPHNPLQVTRYSESRKGAIIYHRGAFGSSSDEREVMCPLCREWTVYNFMAFLNKCTHCDTHLDPFYDRNGYT